MAEDFQALTAESADMSTVATADGVYRYVSLASLAASFALPFASWLTGRSQLLIIVTGCMGALAIYKHRANIKRLLNGTESRFRGTKSKQPEAAHQENPS